MALPQHLSTDDLVKFRTRFCERFLQFGECNFGGKCQYSHNMTWRRRSPQKYLYEPRLCDNIISYTTDNGCRRQSVVNCHNGKNCKFSHSREEILYHPAIYKTVMCEDPNCSKYYCPFGHCAEELLPTNESPEYIKRCLQDVVEIDENDADMLDDDIVDSDIVLMDGLRMRKASGAITGSPMTGASPAPHMGSSQRVHLPVPGSSEWNIHDISAWVQISPAIRIETVVRATSPVVGSELCRALISRTDTAGLAAKKIITQSAVPNQFCLAKVMQLDDSGDTDYSQLVSDLNAISKTDHKNLLSVKKVHVGPMSGSPHQMVCLAIEQCSTSLYQAIVDGYRNGSDAASIRGLAKKMNPHNGSTSLTAVQRISDMISGLQRLHFIGISHLRITPTNVLIDNEASFKLADFLGKAGLTKIFDSGKPPSASSPYLGDAAVVWEAPELVQLLQGSWGKEFTSLNQKKCDVFSLGCVVFFAMTGQHPFGTFALGDRSTMAQGSRAVVENVLSDYISNQHLLYTCPLVLDMCFRTLCINPIERLDVSDLSRHPLFWDFDVTRSFITSLDMANPIIADFLQYPLDWSEVVTSMLNHSVAIAEHFPGIADEVNCSNYSETVSGVIGFLMELWNSAVAHNKRNMPSHVVFASPAFMAPVSGLWLKIFDTFPQILIRAWDGSKLAPTVTEAEYFAAGDVSPKTAFSRNHLHWMSLRASATTCVSHHFVREYYVAVNSLLFKATPFPQSLAFPDESVGLAEASISHAAGLVTAIKTLSNPQRGAGVYFLQDRKNSGLSFGNRPRLGSMTMPQRSPPITPVVSSWNPPPRAMPDAVLSNSSTPVGSVSGMKFVDPAIVKQMAAASAALSAVYDNPELVAAITKGDPTPLNQLIATATIYNSLLNNAEDAGASKW